MGDVLMVRNNSGIKSATGLTGSGSRDWVLQRISAVVLALYAVVMVVFFLFNNVDYETWHGFMMSLPMKLFSLVAILSLVFHAWVGMWTVFTDYVKSAGLRIALQGAVIVAILAYLFWGVMIFW
ncbi:succinate dehydrogenase, hydrophobic membrane anchor protein [Moraxella oblonga]|uniref:succinate dehydrogenase, hydrophobic membrane anchor protein n=1 Tax=Moraxella oblonga TaxID=200413 RepID=UPI001FDF29EB|nr:succinate dehydrogenase, hydrophobic membrane anchor protein [Moraxella oblonga]